MAIDLMPFIAQSCGGLRLPAPKSRGSSASARSTTGRGHTAGKVPSWRGNWTHNNSESSSPIPLGFCYWRVNSASCSAQSRRHMSHMLVACAKDILASLSTSPNSSILQLNRLVFTKSWRIILWYYGAHLLCPTDSAVVGLVLPLLHEKVKFGVSEELVLQLCILVSKVGLALFACLSWSFLFCLQSLEKSAMNFLKRMRSEEKKTIFLIDSFNDSSFLWIVRYYLIILWHDKILYTTLLLLFFYGLNRFILFDHLHFLLFGSFICTFFFNFIYNFQLYQLRLSLFITFLCLLNDFFLEIVVLSGKEPRRRIFPDISAIIQYQMVLFFRWQYLLERFTL